MKWTAVAAAALLVENAAAQFNMLRFACSQLVVDRVDPIVNPGQAYTPHLHQIVGGNSFNVTMDPETHDLFGQSTCTSCNYVEDTSNYWTAVMFFKANNGSYHRVPQVGNGGPQGKLINKGGLDVYYIPSGQTTAFAPGFRMIAGDAAETNAGNVKSNAICHRCWTSTSEDQFIGGAPCDQNDSVEIPQDPSCKMIRQTIIFPTCWDGVNLDSPNHQDHVAYGSGNGADGGGSCPSSHPVKLPQVMYELMWNVTEFANNEAIWPADRKPLVYSMDLGGSAAHGDYVFGWKDDSLQRAMDAGCNGNGDCNGLLTVQSPDTYSACNIPQQAPEEVDGWLASLPLGMPSRRG